jgi:hypothetical protein
VQIAQVGMEVQQFATISPITQVGEGLTMVNDKLNTVKALLSTQHASEEVSEEILTSITKLDKEIQTLTSKVEMQRAAPVLNLPAARYKKGLFTTIQEVEFLCELCHKSVLTVEIRERKKWVKWVLTGIKIVLNFNQSDVLQLSRSMINEIKSQMDINVKDRMKLELQQRMDDLRNSLPMAEEEFDKDLKDIAQELKIPIKGKEQTKESIEEIFLNYAIFFENVVKPKYTIQEVLQLISNKEKFIWQFFSEEEQENIRQFLKNTGNASLYTNILQIRHGLFTCDKCREWLDHLEGLKE